MRTNLPDKNMFIDKSLPSRTDLVMVEWMGSGNDGHVFRAHSTELQRDFACKIIPSANLQGRWRVEVEKANVLRGTTVVQFVDIQTWKDDQNGIDATVLISDFVNGRDLLDFIRKRRDALDLPFVVQFLGTMLDFFNEMAVKGVEHGDFHARNVLVEDRSYALMGPQFVFRVTDFGVARATSSETRFKDDYLQLAFVLRQLLDEVNYQSCSSRDKRLFNALNDQFLARHLTEQDPTRDALVRNPKDLYVKLQELSNATDRSDEESLRIQTPFDFLSCEQIGDAPLILEALYSDRFLGLRDMQSRNNVVVTGPRGCGKSTVFKSMSLHHRMRVDNAHPKQVNEIGVYYRCEDLYFSFPRYTMPGRAEAFDLPVHFVTATLLSELLESLEQWADMYFQPELRAAETQVAQRIWDIIRLPPPRQPGSETLRTIATELQKQRKWAADKQRVAHDPKHPIRECFGVDVLQKVCDALANAYSFLSARPFYFLIDDYSAPKVSKVLQENLNRVFMQRAGTCFFKLSTESPVSFSRSDMDGKYYVENREYVLLNLGLVFLHAEMKQKLDFIEDVFRRRLGAPATPFPVRELSELLGNNEESNFNENARQLREGKKTEFWGEEVLCRLCSGDIHYLISLVGDMVSQSGGPAEFVKTKTGPRIPARLQNKAIRDAAGTFLKNLRSIPRHGEALVAIVSAFGTVAHAYLRHKDCSNDTGNPPWQASRIEPYEPFVLSPKAQLLYDELLRYSVFIEDIRGKSRRGKIVPRLYLRRFLIPHFNLTFSMRDSIELEPSEFEGFLLGPAEFENRMRSRISKAADGGRTDATNGHGQSELLLEFSERIENE